MGKEWDLFEIFDACEDNYTNMLHFFYEIDDKFKYNFLKLIFDEEEVIKDVDFDTRTVYRRGNNGKNIPDIILHNKNTTYHYNYIIKKRKKKYITIYFSYYLIVLNNYFVFQLIFGLQSS